MVASTAVAFVGGVSAMAVSTAVATVLVITDSLMMSSSAAFRVGGAGATRTAIIRTVTMDTADTRMATMDTADTVTMGGPVTDIAMGADEGISGACESVTCPATAL
jgi:uncharacterized sodium:solute symporter family permease YidK